MNTCWNRGVESAAGFIMSYAPRKYNFIKTHIKNMTNFVNLAFNSLDNETMDRYMVVGENVFESPMGLNVGLSLDDV
jgi:hypothetical protein